MRSSREMELQANDAKSMAALIQARFSERHYSVAEIAKLWNLSADCVRRIFEKEPGVLAIGADRTRPRGRRYLTVRIPESVAQRVHRRLSLQGVSKC